MGKARTSTRTHTDEHAQHVRTNKHAGGHTQADTRRRTNAHPQNSKNNTSTYPHVNTEHVQINTHIHTPSRHTQHYFQFTYKHADEEGAVRGWTAAAETMSAVQMLCDT